MDFPGVVRNPLPFVRFRQKDRFSTPLVEKPPAPAAVHRTFIVLLFFLLFFKSKKTIPPLVEEQEADTPPSLSLSFLVINLFIPFCY